MNKNRNYLLLPAALLPYLVLAAVALIFCSGEHPFIMGVIFRGNGLNLLAAVTVYTLAALTLCLVWFLRARKGGQDAHTLARLAMRIKLCQIPAYAAAFVLGVLLLISLFTIPIAMLMMVFCYLSLVMSGLVLIAAALRWEASWKEKILLIAAQFFFCVDVIAAGYLLRRLRKELDVR